jgi:hypothetical protein
MASAWIELPGASSASFIRFISDPFNLLPHRIELEFDGCYLGVLTAMTDALSKKIFFVRKGDLFYCFISSSDFFCAVSSVLGLKTKVFSSPPTRFFKILIKPIWIQHC